MFKKVSVAALLSTTLLFGGVFQTTVDASASEEQSQNKSNSKQNYYFAIENWSYFSWSQLSNYFNKFQTDKNKRVWEYKPIQQDEKEQVEEQPEQEEATEQPEQEEATEQPEQEQPENTKQEEATEQPKQEKQQNQGQSDQLSEYEQQVVELTNNERAKHGLSPLQADWELSRVAHEKSQNMSAKSYFDHNSPTYGSPFDMMKSYGITYQAAGENIAKGQRTPKEVVNGWMNSPGHRANILNESFTHIGTGFVEQGNHWTQMFIGK